MIDIKTSALYEYAANFFNMLSQIDWLYEMGFLFAFIIALFVLCNTRWGYKLPLEKIMSILALVAFLSGVFLYTIGFAHRGNYGHVTFVLFAIISSAEMFLLKSEYSFISDICKDSPGYMLMFSLTYLTAIFCSIMFVLRAIGIRMGAWLKMLIARVTAPLNAGYDLYVFFYPNNSVIQLARSIYKQNKWYKRKVKLLFVCKANVDNYVKKDVAQMIGLYSDKKEQMDTIFREEMDSLVVFCTKDIAECNSVNEDYLKMSGINQSKILFKYAASVKLLILTENEKRNLETAHKLAGDITIERCNEVGKHVDIYCMARKCNTNSTLEEMMLKTNEDVHVIDSSYLSVATLKMNPSYLPISFVDSEGGVVKSAFHALIIGFNETGQEALKFLYEYGAFLGMDDRRSPFHCIAIDSNMNSLMGKFYMDIPGLRGEKDIQLLQMTAGTNEFWDMLEKDICQLNYIVIASGNDENDIALAIDIYKVACRYRRNNLKYFKIFVRSYKAGNEIKLVSLQRYYNRLNMKESGGGEIVVFGKEQDIYSYRMIILDEMKRKAKKAYDVYNKLTNENKSWEDRRKELIGSNNLFAYQALKRKEGQDFSSAYHVDTKMILAGVKNPNRMTADELQRIRQLRAMFTVMERHDKKWLNVNTEDASFKLLENLAKNEHLRWNASHILLGYVPDKSICGCDEVTKRHKCLVSWNELLEYDTDFQYYDYKFVEMALKIKEDEMKRG